MKADAQKIRPAAQSLKVGHVPQTADEEVFPDLI